LNQIVRVNLNDGSIKKEKMENDYLRKGGRALTAAILHDEVEPQCDPLGEDNKLIFAAGLLTGTGVSSSARLSAGAKSPLTGGIKESNSGGIFGQIMVRSGIRALVFEGLPADDSLKVLVIDGNEFTLENADYLENKSVFETFQGIKEKYGEKAGIVCIGQAGERKLPASAILSVDPFGHARAMARGGLGAVMGAKRIKAIVARDNKDVQVEPADAVKLKELRKKFNQMVLDDPRLESRKQYGTAAIMKAMNSLGAMPTRSFRQGTFEHIDNISGEKLHDNIVERKGKGKISAPCMVGCLISCGNVYPDTKGEVIVSTLQYETIVLLGSNLGMDNLDDIAVLNKLCNDYGLDTIETGCVLGILMDVGMIEYGDVGKCKEVLEQVATGTPLGRIVGSGAAVTAKVFGTTRVPVGRNQGLPAYDPRALKGNGVTYITSPMGGDHTAGNAFGARDKVDPLGKENQVELSKGLQVDCAIVDLLGICLFARTPVAADMGLVAELINNLLGLELNKDDIYDLARETLRLEEEFNQKAGLIERRLPEFFYKEKLPPHNTVFDVSQEEIDNMRIG